jgi:hypothetical protein
MKIGNFKNFSLKKKGAGTPPDEVVIESTTAEQIAEMKKRLASRTQDLEQAKTRLDGLSPDDDEEEEKDDAIGPHPPLQELTLDDIDDDEEDDDVKFDTPAGEGSPVQLVDMTKEEAEPEEESLNLEDVDEKEKTGEKEEGEEEVSLEGEGNDLKNLFGEEEEDEHALANLINFLPDVSVQELQDDIEEIKGIIKEWQQTRHYGG